MGNLSSLNCSSCGPRSELYRSQSEVEPLKQPAENRGAGYKSKLLPIGGACCCVVTLMIIAAGFILIAKTAGDELVRKHFQWATNITACETGEGEWTDPPIIARVVFGQQPVFHCRRGHGDLLTPANYTDYISFDSCMPAKLKEAMADFNADADWKLVGFPSRNGSHGQLITTIAAWWLPVANNQAPRIVLQHGNNANFNDQTVAVAAYLLRSMGFACLVPNLRDHGMSSPSDHESVGWGWDYHLDLLGAWDYAVNDPIGELGGSINRDQVGLMGFSMGGFITLISFGLEPSVPAAWVDSAVFEPNQVLRSRLNRMGLGFLTDLSLFFARQTAGIDLDLWTPEKALPRDVYVSPPRAVYLAHGLHDTAVPVSQSDAIESLISDINEQGNGVLYDLVGYYKPDYRCGDSNHCSMHLWNPDAYREQLCDFWTIVFNMDQGDCGLADLPKFGEDDNSTNGTVPSASAPVATRLLLL